MEFSERTLTPSSDLLYQEESQSTNLDCDENDIIFEEIDEYMQILINREINSNGIQNQDSIKQARLDAIHYIFQTRLLFGFKIQTGYLAVTYMDRFLSKKFIKDEKYWVLPLLGISCLSLAAKMEENRVFELSKLDTEKKFSFENRVIQRMELLVLDTLEWKMKLITPFHFINFFVSNFCQENNSTSKVIQVLLNGIKDEITVKDRPSVIAAAATLFTFDQALTMESLVHKIHALPCINCLNIEEVFCLYNRFIKQQEARNFEYQNKGISPPLSPSFQLQHGTNSSKPIVGSKRKSIHFGESSTKLDTVESDDTEQH